MMLTALNVKRRKIVTRMMSPLFYLFRRITTVINRSSGGTTPGIYNPSQPVTLT